MNPDKQRRRLDQIRRQFGFGEKLTEDHVNAIRDEFPEIEPASEEVLIVKPNGLPTDSRLSADRKLCHLFGWRHRCAHVFLLSEDSRRLVVQVRGAAKDESPGALDLTVGGHIKGGRGRLKEFHNGAVEELREELGIGERDLENHRLVRVGRPYACCDIQIRTRWQNDIYNAEVRQIFHGVLARNAIDRIRFADGEISDIRLVEIEDAWRLLRSQNIASGLRFSLPIYLSWLQYHK